MRASQRRRLEALATEILDLLNAVDDGDATESLASIYAAAQVYERELVVRGHLDPGALLYVQDQGRRVGAGMAVVVDEEVMN